MFLLDLRPRLYAMPHIDPADGRETWERAFRMGDAAGVRFLCPVCFVANGGLRGTHGIVCWSGAVPAHFTPGPGRWDMLGTGLHDLTLIGASGRSDSILLTGGGCGAHFFVRNGYIE